MAWRQHINFLPVKFVKAKTDESDWFSAGCPTEDSAPEEKIEDGKEVKAFYEKLVGLDGGDLNKSSVPSFTRNPDVGCERTNPKLDSNQTNNEQASETKCSIKHTTSAACTSHLLNEYLQAAQNGDVKHVCKMLRDGINIDGLDQYQWTALMCATQAGHQDIVKILLDNGANKYLLNSHGKTALDIAKGAKHNGIVQLLEGAVSDTEDKDTVSVKPFYCKICQARFCDVSETAHRTSTIHLFNMKLEPKQTLYQISEANRGFQMMLRSGWNEEKGLGKEGQGQKFPVKTILKRDRQGLGCKTKTKPKITHFGANDMKAVKRVKNPNREMRLKTMGKRARLAAEKKERQKEINFRREFYAE